MKDLLIRARIWTGDPDRPRAEAAVVSGGRFVFVGGYAEARAAYPEAEVADYGENMMMPGMMLAVYAVMIGIASKRGLDVVGRRDEAFKREREAPRPFRTDDKRNVRRSLRVNVFHRRQGEYCIRQHRNRCERETRNTICDETSYHLSSLYRCFS